MNVLFVIAEMAPLVKVGGVGDVGGSLPKTLRRLGHDVRVALPFYKSIDRSIAREQVASSSGATVWRAEYHGLPIYLIEHESFNRDEVYGYEDDVARFLSFCEGVLASLTQRQAEPVEAWTPDVLHMHDWHTGLLASRLQGDGHPWSNAATVFTIHNLAYRGEFPVAFAKEHGLPRELFAAPRRVERDVPYCGLAQGILHSSVVSTVSPTYAREILEPKQSGAMAPLLQSLGGRLEGILNGIDNDEYDPARDSHLSVNYEADSLDKRAANKAVLQQKMGLPASGVPVVGMVTRLFEQKAPDLAADAVAMLLPETDFQFVVLGTGEARYEKQLSNLAASHSDRVGVQLAFDHALGQQIYGGCDIFLMPSRYEPCGIGQMIAMRYGAVPVVRRTGGLADSVAPYDADKRAGIGFVFDALRPDALAEALREAISAFEDKRSWRALQQRGMRSDFSWDNAARQYIQLYERAGVAGIAK